MASSINNPIPQTVEGYKELAQRDLVLIEAQRDEIQRLKVANNQLRQKLTKGMKYSKSISKLSRGNK